MDEDFGCVTFLVRHAWHSMRGVVAAALVDQGLSVAQYGTMLLMSEKPASTIAEVARQVGTTRQSANELVTGMERAGLIERRAHPSDRRSQQIHLTETGRDRLEAATPIVREVEARLEADLSPADRAAARIWLQRMVDSELPS